MLNTANSVFHNEKATQKQVNQIITDLLKTFDSLVETTPEVKNLQ